MRLGAEAVDGLADLVLGLRTGRGLGAVRLTWMNWEEGLSPLTVGVLMVESSA